jgi:tetratricopeptide (TPR) repeat protein
MRAALGRWDESIRRLEAAAAPQLRRAETHLVLGSAYLDRQRTADAVRAFTEASQIDSGRADVRVSLALSLAADGKVPDALRELREAVGLDARQAPAVYTLAHLLRTAGRADDARQALQQFARLRLSAPVPSGASSAPRTQPFERAGLFRQAAGIASLFPVAGDMDAFARIDAGDYAGALDALARAADAAAPAGEDQRVAGLAAWVAGDHNTALRELRQAVNAGPGDARARLALAFVLRNAGRPSEAEQELRAAVEAFPDLGLAWYRLGQFYEGESRLSEAAAAFERSLAQPPILGRDALHQRLARVRVNQADFDGAIAAYVNRVTVNPNSAEAHRSLGEIYFLQGRDDEALAEFLAAVWLDPMDARAFAALGKVQVRAQRYADAVPPLRRALALDGARADAHYALAQALARTGRAEEARAAAAEFERLDALERARGQRDFRLEQRRVDAARLLNAGETEAAIAALRALADEDPGTARWPRELGAAFMRTRRFDDSIAALETAQAREPSPETDRLLADAYEAAGRADDARAVRARYDTAARQARLTQLLNVETGP